MIILRTYVGFFNGQLKIPLGDIKERNKLMYRSQKTMNKSVKYLKKKLFSQNYQKNIHAVGELLK